MIAEITGYYNVKTTNLTTVIESVIFLEKDQGIDGVIDFIGIELPLTIQSEDWHQLRDSLFKSKAFLRSLQSPEILNIAIYGALQTILSTEGDLQYLLFCLQNVMTYLQDEKTQINQILTDSNFIIQII